MQAKKKGDIESLTKTLTEAVIALQEKIEQQTPLVEEMTLYQSVTVGTGETVLRSNPQIQEYRALIRDYTQALKSLREMSGENIVSYDKHAKLHVVGSSKWKKRA